MGVKFGTEEGTKGPLLPAKFQPHWCNYKGVGPPKLKFLLRFDQNVEYKRPAGAYPLRDYHKIYRFCNAFQDALAVKIWLDLLEGLRSYVGFKYRVSGYTQIFSAPSGETMRRAPKSFGDARTCLRSSITMPSLVGLGFHRSRGGQKR